MALSGAPLIHNVVGAGVCVIVKLPYGILGVGLCHPKCPEGGKGICPDGTCGAQ